MKLLLIATAAAAGAAALALVGMLADAAALGLAEYDARTVDWPF